MKYKIKENLRSHILILSFILILLMTIIYFLMVSKSVDQSSPVTPVPGIIILDKNKPVPAAGGKLEVTLLLTNVDTPNCADCMEQARIQVKKDNETTRLNYRFGGIAGFHEDTAEAFGYTFIMRELQQDTVTLEYKPTAQ